MLIQRLGAGHGLIYLLFHYFVKEHRDISVLLDLKKSNMKVV